MTSKEIKTECDSLVFVIKSSEERIQHLQSICKHEKEFKGNFSWRVGATLPAIICAYCGKFIRTTIKVNE